jgi:hypothetical protein
MFYFLVGTGLSEPDKLPNLSSETNDWNQFIFSGIYSIGAGSECSVNDEPVLSMTYPGVQPTCYAEDISLNDANIEQNKLNEEGKGAKRP